MESWLVGVAGSARLVLMLHYPERIKASPPGEAGTT